MKNLTKTAALSAVTTLAFLGACTNTEQVDQGATPIQATQSVDGNTPVTVDDARAAGESAREAAEADAGASGGIVIDIDPERNGEWDVDVVVGDTVYEVTVDGQGATHVTDREAADGEDVAASGAKINIYDAIERALAETPGVFRDASFDDVAWQVDIDVDRVEYQVFVDPDNGEILGVEQDD